MRLSPALLLAALLPALDACGQSAADAGHGPDPSAPCVSCHLAEYQGARDHSGLKPTTCAVCHTSDAWHPTGLHHPWPLTGAHEKTGCFDCHKGDPVVFKGTPKACVGCHRSQFESAPDHVAHFATTCEDCHTTSAWKPLVAAPKWPPAQPTTTGTAKPEGSAKPPPPRPKPPPHPKPPPSPSTTGTPPEPPLPPPDTTSHATPRAR